MRPAGGRRPRGGQNAAAMRVLFLLAAQLQQMDTKPPLTLALVALNVLNFFQPELLPFMPPLRDACLQPFQVLQGFEFGRLLWSSIVHADEMHLFYNMSSLLWKGAQLEPAMGSVAFGALIAELLVMSHLITVFLAYALSIALPSIGEASYYSSCMVGFSAVLFGLKVVLNSHSSAAWTRVAGIDLPSKWACWAELALIQLATPNASFLGHLSGILAGLLHVALLRHLSRARLRQQLRRLLQLFGLASPARFGGQPRYATGDWPRYATSMPVHRTAAQQNGNSGEAPQEATLSLDDLPDTPMGDTRQRRADRDRERRRAAAEDRALRAATSRRRAGLRSLIFALPRIRWHEVLSWRGSALAVVALGFLAATNPSADHFVRHVAQTARSGLGPVPGLAAGTLAWLQGRTGLGLSHTSFLLFSLVRYQGIAFIGLANSWFPILPLRLLGSGHWKAMAAALLIAGLALISRLRRQVQR